MFIRWAFSMTELRDVPERVKDGSPNPINDMGQYSSHYSKSISDSEEFWLGVTKKSIVWRDVPSKILEGSFDSVAEEPLRWFSDGTLNVSESCLDRHLALRRDKIAIIWEGDEPDEIRRITYGQLHSDVCRLSNALISLGVSKGDRVIVYMGMVPEAAVAMLACARIGAIHSVVFGGFSSESLRDRVIDCGAKVILTQDEGVRGGKRIPLKSTVDDAISGIDSIDYVVIFRRTGAEIKQLDHDVWWHDIISDVSEQNEATIVDSEHPLFILYTSGSTGKPKGLVHTSGGYLTYVTHTHRTVFDLREDDIYACVADVGWITGHSYIVYGPLSNGATTFMFESTPLYPDAGRYWDMVQRHGMTIFYTAPTAIRALAAMDESFVSRSDMSSLRVLGTVGEPINPEAWEWYFDIVGGGNCNIVDTWWQTETGGICISPIAPATPTVGGSATLPLLGIVPQLMDENGNQLEGESEGLLCLTNPWPGQARTIWGDHNRFVDVYFSMFPGKYFTGDGCRRDSKGYYWITGRVDDVLNVSGHRMGTAEFESVLVTLEEVAEAAIVGFPHSIKGTGVYAFLVLQEDLKMDEDIMNKANIACRKSIGSHAKIDLFQKVPGLPKTRSGKVMRRILRKIAEGEPDSLGDISTLADPSVVATIVSESQL